MNKSIEELSFKEKLEKLIDQLYKETGKKRDKFNGAIELLGKIIKNNSFIGAETRI